MNCKIPSNIRPFFTEYLGVSKTSIPFDVLPDWINPLTYLNYFSGHPYNDRFAELGYVSLSFVYNFSNQLGTWFTAFLTFLMACAFSRVLPCTILANTS